MMEMDVLYTLVLLATQKLYIRLKKYFNKKTSDLCVLHHSNNFLVVNKKYDLLINTNNISIKETLQTQLMNYCPSNVNAQLTHKFHFVHRLDFITSGVVCIAMHRKAAKAAGDSFVSRHARKYYVALVRGWIEGDRLSIHLAIGEDALELETSKRMCVEGNPQCIRPRDAQTRLIVLQRGLYDGYPATKVLLRPLTGRRHQLRVHLSYIGHTIIGDFTYSQRKDVKPPRTFLHALRLVLPNAIEPLDIKTEDPFICVPNWQTLECVYTLSNTFHLLDEDSENGMIF